MRSPMQNKHQKLQRAQTTIGGISGHYINAQDVRESREKTPESDNRDLLIDYEFKKKE